MPGLQPKYDFLRPGDMVSVGVDLPDRSFAEDQATVIASGRGEILLNLCGKGFPAHMQVDGGTRVVIARAEGRSFFHCTALLKEKPDSGSIKVTFPEMVTVRERREYTRSDVMMQIHYAYPSGQEMGLVIAEWEELRNCYGSCMGGIRPVGCINSRVNLSGSGLRFKIKECLSYGTLLHLKIEIPGDSAGHIHAVGSIIRTKELLPEMNRLEYYSTAMSLKMIESGDRQKLLRYIIDAQRKAA
jgi:c-di-GMP-binding flagellar brake protein YcgR